MSSSPVTKADLLNSLQHEPIRHVFVEVHDDQGNYEDAPAGFAVLCLTDTFVRAIKERSAVLQGMHSELSAPGSELASGPILLMQRFSAPGDFSLWGYAHLQHMNTGQTGLWEIVINASEEAVVILHHDEGQYHTTGIEVSRLPLLGRSPETAFIVRENMEWNLADAMGDYVQHVDRIDTSTTEIERSLRRVHTAIVASCPEGTIDLLDEDDGIHAKGPTP